MFAKSKSQGVDVGKKCYDQFGGERKTGGAFFAPPLHSGSKRVCMIVTYLEIFQAVVSSTTGSMYIAEE